MSSQISFCYKHLSCTGKDYCMFEGASQETPIDVDAESDCAPTEPNSPTIVADFEDNYCVCIGEVINMDGVIIDTGIYPIIGPRPE